MRFYNAPYCTITLDVHEHVARKFNAAICNVENCRACSILPSAAMQMFLIMSRHIISGAHHNEN